MKNLLLLFTVVLLIGCANSRFIPTGFDDSNQRAALAEDTRVSVITELPEDAKKIVEIGICKGTVPGGGLFTDRTHKAVEKIKDCARENGGNAIILDRTADAGYDNINGQQTAKAQGRIYYIEL
jgi:hypothetical protein